MKVTLIDYTGCGRADPADYAARFLVYIKNTRLQQGEATRRAMMEMPPAMLADELSKVAKSIRSSWEFVDYTFEVADVTRAYTHQQVRTRVGASFAQQAQRVVDLSHFDTRVPATVKNADQGNRWDALMDNIAETYAFYQDKNVPNQDCRGVLPTNVLTNIICKFNLRTMADLAGKRGGLRAQDEYGEVIAGMKSQVLAVHPWAAEFIDPVRSQTPALDAIMKMLLGTDSPVDHPYINDALKEIDALKGTWG